MKSFSFLHTHGRFLWAGLLMCLITGSLTLHIKKEDSEEWCTEMMEMWLEGKGRQPVTWATLIELLEDAEHKRLAEQLKEVLLTL